MTFEEQLIERCELKVAAAKAETAKMQSERDWAMAAIGSLLGVIGVSAERSESDLGDVLLTAQVRVSGSFMHRRASSRVEAASVLAEDLHYALLDAIAFHPAETRTVSGASARRLVNPEIIRKWRLWLLGRTEAPEILFRLSRGEISPQEAIEEYFGVSPRDVFRRGAKLNFPEGRHAEDA